MRLHTTQHLRPRRDRLLVDSSIVHEVVEPAWKEIRRQLRCFIDLRRVVEIEWYESKTVMVLLLQLVQGGRAERVADSGYDDGVWYRELENA